MADCRFWQLTLVVAAVTDRLPVCLWLGIRYTLLLLDRLGTQKVITMSNILETAMQGNPWVLWRTAVLAMENGQALAGLTQLATLYAELKSLSGELQREVAYSYGVALAVVGRYAQAIQVPFLRL
jgi:hypothetical protein